MKKTLSITLVMLMTFALMAPLSFASVSVQDVKSAFADSVVSTNESESMLNVKTENGESVKDWTNPELIHKMYNIKNDGDAEKDIFSAYKSGSFGSEIDTGNYYWMIPQLEGGSAVKEYYYYPGAAKTDGSADIKGNASGLRIIYSYDELSAIISDANIGAPQSVKRAIITYPSPTIFLYITGVEEQVKAASYNEVFIDVSEEKWSFPYVMYCYENGITKGIGNNQFMPEKEISAEEFTTFILRLLGYVNATPETAYGDAVKITLLNTEFVNNLKTKNNFLRDDMVYIVYRSLKTKTSNGIILADVLANNGVITKAQAEEFDIYENAENIDDILDGIMN